MYTLLYVFKNTHTQCRTIALLRNCEHLLCTSMPPQPIDWRNMTSNYAPNILRCRTRLRYICLYIYVGYINSTVMAMPYIGEIRGLFRAWWPVKCLECAWAKCGSLGWGVLYCTRGSSRPRITIGGTPYTDAHKERDRFDL